MYVLPLLYVLIQLPASCSAQGALPPEKIRIVGGSVAAAIGTATGTVRTLADSHYGVTLTAASSGEAFRLILRDSERAIHIIRSSGQAPPSWATTSTQATASWAGPLRDDHGNLHDIGVRVTYAVVRTLTGGSELRIWLSLNNRSQCTVLEVWMPTVGGLADLGGEVVGSNPANRRALRLPFGDWAPHYPGAIPMGFVDIGGPTGLYFGAQETLARIKLLRVMELDGDIAARITHLPFLQPRGRFRSCAAVCRFHRGGFEEAGRIYRRWFLRTFGMKDPRKDWLRRQSFFQMTMIMLPEGNIRYRIRDIPRLAADAKKYGVTAIQIAGWQRGGHDNGYPYYEPDPRLGTWEDLRKAIAECHRMGVRVFFFVNLQVAMLDLNWYKRELRGYEMESENGDPFWVAGWGMGTLASRMGLTTPMMAFLDPAFPRYSEALLHYYRKLASIGADGVHVDKMFPQAVTANPMAPMPADTSTWEGAIRFLKRMDRECRAINPQWRVSNECAWDRVLQVGTTTWWAGNMTAVKAVFPETAETVGLYQPYDFAGVNDAVREGWAVMVAPYHFQRSMDEPAWRGLARYIRDVKAIRDRLADAVFLGERARTEEVTLQATGGRAQWSVFRNPASGRRVCVVTNNSIERATCVLSGWSGSRAGAVRVHIPGKSPVLLALPATVEVAEERLIFFEELPASVPAPKVHVIRLPRDKDPLPGVRRPFANADFEGGTLDGWKADANWTVDDNSAGGWYSGWQGRKFAWSGRGGEPRTGRLRSPIFALDAEGVQVSIAGWADISGRTPNRWNYVTLNLETGQELDRAYAPNTTQFQPVILMGPGHRGKRVYLEAVDDGTEETYSMICIDDVRLWDPPREQSPKVAPAPNTIVLENGRYRLEIGRANGTIVRLRDKVNGEEVIREPRLADNWRISLPMRDAVSRGTQPRKSAWERRWPEAWRNHDGNYVQGRIQRLTHVSRTADGLRLRWGPPLRAEDGAKYPVTVTMHIRLVGDTLRFETTVTNKSTYELGEVYAPILGGLQGLGAYAELRKNTEVVLPQNGGLTSSRPFHSFASQSWLGIFGPERYAVYPSSLDAPWIALSQRQGRRLLYFGAHDPVARLKVFHLEQVPGVSGARPSGNWPRPEELRGRPAGVRMAWVHIPYESPGKTFQAGPVIVQAMTGEPSDAARVYTSWFRSRVRAPVATLPGTSRQVGRSSFREIESLAQEAARTGEGALTLTAWKRGSPGDGVPLLEPDPGLGGWAGLRSAANICRRRRVRLILQVTMNPVSRRSELFRTTLYRFQCVDRWGVPQTVMGWSEPRCTAEVFSGGERRGYVNTGHPGFRAWFVRQVERLAEAGISGIHLQGFFPTLLDFNPTVGSTPDKSLWEGALATIEAAGRAARRHVPDFSITVEERRDYTMPLE